MTVPPSSLLEEITTKLPKSIVKLQQLIDAKNKLAWAMETEANRQ